ncbi:sulfhydryl oxidase 1 isoform X2 [Engystomops pustulosus]|uniref:sulfhydryl oxidase 1 isoform X2 n=1 Tax=Engystomops pustulosus TaxID=76066 RepID=UPI003AFB2F06
MMPGMERAVPGVWLLLLLLLGPARAHLYGEDDPLVSLEKGAQGLLLNSSSCWLAQFFASWCGHCRSFTTNWMILANDVKDWRPAVYLSVLDCAKESNSKMCNSFGIQGYPTVQFFNTFSKQPSDGIRLYDRKPDMMKRFLIDKLEAQKESPPPACPPLEPISAPEIDYFFENNDESFLTLIFEEHSSYMAREVALDMVQYQGVSVRRVLKEQADLVERFNVSSLPSGFLLCRNGSFSKIRLMEECREEYTKFVRSLPGVKRTITNLIGWSANPVDDAVVQKTVNSSAIYIADLESSLHYSLRVEVARFSVLTGDRLKALTMYLSVLKKYFPARPYLRTLLNSLHSWLYRQRGKIVTYTDFADVLNNKDQKQKAVLTPNVNFVWCQGSKPEFRGYPCSVWTLFHMLTVRAAELGSSNPHEVLKAMRSHVRFFFGCRDCAEHFEKMAAESMNSVRNMDDAIRWLWLSHNRVNKRLAGDATEDPHFPKIQWPSKELCPDCRKMINNETTWDTPAVLNFMKKRFSENNLLYDYAEDEAVLLEKQNKRAGGQRTKRMAEDDQTDPEKQTVIQTIIPAIKAKEPEDRPTDSKGKPSSRHRATIIKMKSFTAIQNEREEDDIVDLDNSELHYFPRRTLQDSNKNGYAIQSELMLDLPDSDFDQEAVRLRLLKRGVDANSLIGVVAETGEVNWKGRWVKMLEVGFSRLDISICVFLYFLTSMCLLGMYLFLSFRSRFRQRCLYPQL